MREGSCKIDSKTFFDGCIKCAHYMFELYLFSFIIICVLFFLSTVSAKRKFSRWVKLLWLCLIDPSDTYNCALYGSRNTREHEQLTGNMQPTRPKAETSLHISHDEPWPTAFPVGEQTASNSTRLILSLSPNISLLKSWLTRCQRYFIYVPAMGGVKHRKTDFLSSLLWTLVFFASDLIFALCEHNSINCRSPPLNGVKIPRSSAYIRWGSLSNTHSIVSKGNRRQKLVNTIIYMKRGKWWGSWFTLSLNLLQYRKKITIHQ